MLEARPDGLSSSEEAQTLWAFEDQLAAALDRSCSAVLAGRITTLGRREFYFYGAHANGFREGLKSVMDKFPLYVADSDSQSEPNWNQYRNVLYPSAEQWEMIGNQDVLASLAKQGDDHSIARPVYHSPSFLMRYRARSTSLKQLSLAISSTTNTESKVITALRFVLCESNRFNPLK